MRRRFVAGCALAVALCVTAGCSGGPVGSSTDGSSTDGSSADATPDGSGTGRPTVTSTASPRPSDASDVPSENLPPASALPRSADPSGEALVVTGVRAGGHEGYDRVVIDLEGLEGDGRPGYVAGYGGEPPRGAGSGELIELDGDAVLSVRITGLTNRMGGDTGPVRGPVEVDGPVIRSAHWDNVFEGEAWLFLGVAGGEQPYRVFTLEEPSRLVVDVEAG